MDNRTNGIDASPDRRPGVPMETDPHPAGAAHWNEPARMPDPGNVLKRKNLDALTPVFSTANPPRGISGQMRRAAYQIPEYKTSHWFLLLLADRVDAIEHGRARWVLPFAFLLLAGGATALILAKKRA